jgi:hypothetical protein
MNNVIGARPPAWLRIAALVALVWNLIGIAFYLGHVGLLGGAFAAADPGAPMPVWATSAWAISVFAGAIGALGLALLASWSRNLLWLSLLAAIPNWGWVFFLSGAGIQPLGIAVLAIAAGMVWLATTAAGRHWLS